MLIVVFRTDEQTKVETIRDILSLDTQRKYDEATTYNDGKWLILAVNTHKVEKGVMRLPALKRRPKKKQQSITNKCSRRPAAKETVICLTET